MWPSHSVVWKWLFYLILLENWWWSKIWTSCGGILAWFFASQRPSLIFGASLEHSKGRTTPLPYNNIKMTGWVGYMNSKQPRFCQFHLNTWILFLFLNQTSILHLPLIFEIKELLSFGYLSLFQISQWNSFPKYRYQGKDRLGTARAVLTSSGRLQAAVVKDCYSYLHLVRGRGQQ